MSRSTRVAAVMALAALCLDSSAASAQGQADRAIEQAQQLVHAAFGELREKGFKVILYLERSFERDWTAQGPLSLTIHKEHHSGTGEMHSEILLTGRFWMGRNAAYLSDATFYGSYVHQDRLRAVDDSIRMTPAITDEEIESMLVAQKARFPPAEKAAFVRAARLERYQPAIGAFTIDEVRFLSGAPPDPGRPLWSISLRSSKESPVQHCYSLLFEPFDGRLVHFVSGPCAGEH
jgi:hypothetical protein